ncbi:MAG TPA: hypothetical protein VHY48_10695 [Acidobacteriaceae bacterium]|jgi:hypothetical protein|nr:hypothetical protein [Acidobacteriaceae bacterium]
MRILFAISLVALAALLWASASIAQHIHSSRRRRHQPPQPSQPHDHLEANLEANPEANATPLPRPSAPLAGPGRVTDTGSTHHRKAS